MRFGIPGTKSPAIWYPMEYHISERDMHAFTGIWYPLGKWYLAHYYFALAKTHACANSGIVFCKLITKLRRNDNGMGVRVKIIVLAVGMTHVPALDIDHVLRRSRRMLLANSSLQAQLRGSCPPLILISSHELPAIVVAS